MDDVPVSRSELKFDFSVERVAGGAAISLFGELDSGSRDIFVTACREVGATGLVIGIENLVFMDCAGWGGIVEVRRCTPSATIRGARGQPARLIDLLSTLELSHSMCSGAAVVG